MCDPDVREEAEKKWRKVSESSFGEDDQSLLKSSRIKSPLLFRSMCPPLVPDVRHTGPSEDDQDAIPIPLNVAYIN